MFSLLDRQVRYALLVLLLLDTVLILVLLFSRRRCRKVILIARVSSSTSTFLNLPDSEALFFMSHRIRRLLEYDERLFYVTATTGIAALQVNGTTLHAWAGIGLGKESVMQLFDRLG